MIPYRFFFQLIFFKKLNYLFFSRREGYVLSHNFPFFYSYTVEKFYKIKSENKIHAKKLFLSFFPDTYNHWSQTNLFYIFSFFSKKITPNTCYLKIAFYLQLSSIRKVNKKSFHIILPSVILDITAITITVTR
jgi:hypothetical protein